MQHVCKKKKRLKYQMNQSHAFEHMTPSPPDVFETERCVDVVLMLTGGGGVRHGPFQRQREEQRKGLLHLLQLAVGAAASGPPQGSESRVAPPVQPGRLRLTRDILLVCSRVFRSTT